MKKFALLFGLLLLISGLGLLFIDTPFKYLFQANTYSTSGKVAKAVKLLEEGHKKYPDNNKITFALAKAYYLIGETELANKTIFLKDTIISLRCDRNFRSFLVDLSDENHNLGNERIAKSLAKEYLVCKRNIEPTQKTIKNLIRVGQILPENSVELWEEGFNIAHALKEPELKESIKALLLPKYFRTVDALKKEKKYDEALKILNRAKAMGKCAEVSYEQAKLFADIGKIDLAQSSFEEALQLEPDNDEYKISYANALKKAALSTKDRVKANEYFEKIKLLLAGDDPVKASLLKKIINLNAKYKITNSNLGIKLIGEYLYPSLTFKIDPVSDIYLKGYKVIFLNNENMVIDEYEATLTKDELNQIIEVTARNPVESNTPVNAKLFVNNEFVKEYNIK